MKKKLLAVSLVAFPLFVSADPTALVTGNDYLYLYQKSQDSTYAAKDLYRMYIYGYSKGVSSTFSDAGLICPPPETTLDQTANAIGNYLIKNEKARSDKMSDVMSASLSAAYPCVAK